MQLPSAIQQGGGLVRTQGCVLPHLIYWVWHHASQYTEPAQIANEDEERGPHGCLRK